MESLMRRERVCWNGVKLIVYHIFWSKCQANRDTVCPPSTAQVITYWISLSLLEPPAEGKMQKPGPFDSC